MTHAGPLPKTSTYRTPGLAGVWRGYVERVSPDLAVSVPALTGQGVIGKAEAAFGLPVTVGARVWVACIEGVRTDILVIALRA